MGKKRDNSMTDTGLFIDTYIENHAQSGKFIKKINQVT
jgi:hypothetical protein